MDKFFSILMMAYSKNGKLATSNIFSIWIILWYVTFLFICWFWNFSLLANGVHIFYLLYMPSKSDCTLLLCSLGNPVWDNDTGGKIVITLVQLGRVTLTLNATDHIPSASVFPSKHYYIYQFYVSYTVLKFLFEFVALWRRTQSNITPKLSLE